MWTTIGKVLYVSLMTLLFLWANSATISFFNKNLNQLNMYCINPNGNSTVRFFMILITVLSFIVALVVLGFSVIMMWKYVLSDYAMSAFELLTNGGATE